MRRRHFITYCEYISACCPKICEPNRNIDCCDKECPLAKDFNCNIVLKSRGEQGVNCGCNVIFMNTFHNTDCPLPINGIGVGLAPGAYLVNFSCERLNGTGCSIALYLNNELIIEVKGERCICFTKKITVRRCRLSIKNPSQYICINNPVLSIVKLY